KPKGYEVKKELIPDSWCEPKIVVEIQADNITKSPIHTAGLALRFPRLVRFKDDRSAQQATTAREVEDLFRLQFGGKLS
ncbi:MAG: DNA ligase, partial [Microgenomates group bacterium]